VRIILILLLLSLILFAYPVWRLGEWLQISIVANALITTPLFLSQVIARVLLRHRKGRLVYACRGAADFFLGLSPILLLLVLVGEVMLAVFQWPSAYVAYGILVTTAVAGIWGLAKAWTPDIVRVELSSAKLHKPVRFAQISDVHIGSRTSRFLGHVIDLVNDQNPDFLCITGDFIDQPGISLEKLKPLTLFKGPIYYCIGNHERYEDLDEIVNRLESLGVEVLRNRAMVADGLQFIGIDDHESSRQVARVLPFLEVREDLYSILLYHRPQGLEDAHQHGIDLKLSGHTHAGQIVPFHLAVNKVFEYRKGLYQFENTHLYVNEGTGTWGPTLRLGTRSEITVFELSPGENAGN
jgi:predicted MPP superfamily phosphohydrolase